MVIFSLVVYYILKVAGSSGNGIYLADLGSTWRSSFPPNCFLFFPPLVLEVDLSYWLVLEHVYYCFLTMMHWWLTLNWVFPSHFWVDFGCMERVDPIPFPLNPDWHCHFSPTLPNRGENWSHRKYNLSRKTGPKVHKSAPSVPNIWSNMSNFLALNLNFPPLQYGGFWPTRKTNVFTSKSQNATKNTLQNSLIQNI